MVQIQIGSLVLQVSSSSTGKSGQQMQNMRRSTSLEVSGMSETRRRKSKKISWADLDSLEEVFREDARSEDGTGLKEDVDNKASGTELEHLVHLGDHQGADK